MMEVFVFQLDEMVFFPTAAQPLHVFEPKYIQLVEDSIRGGIPIALTFLDPTLAGESGRELVCGVGEPIICEKRADGTLVVLVRGLARVKLANVIRKSPYLVCDASLLMEQNRVSDSSILLLERLRKILMAWLDRAVEDADYRDAIAAQLVDPETLVEAYAAHQVHDTDLKQALLERTDINDRIRILSSFEASDFGFLASA